MAEHDLFTNFLYGFANHTLMWGEIIGTDEYLEGGKEAR